MTLAALAAPGVPGALASAATESGAALDAPDALALAVVPTRLPWNPARPAADVAGMPQDAWLRLSPPASLAAGPYRGEPWGFESYAFNLGQRDFDGLVHVEIPEAGRHSVMPARLASLYSEQPETWYLRVSLPTVVGAHLPDIFHLRLWVTDHDGRPASEVAEAAFEILERGAPPCDGGVAVVRTASAQRVVWSWDVPFFVFTLCNGSAETHDLALHLTDAASGLPLAHAHAQMPDHNLASLAPGEHLTLTWVLTPRLPQDVRPVLHLLGPVTDLAHAGQTMTFGGLGQLRPPDPAALPAPLPAP